MHVFVNTKLTYMDDATKMRVKERIANLDGKRKAVQGIDAVVRLYKALEIAEVFVEAAEKKAMLLKAIGQYVGVKSRDIVAGLPLRYNVQTSFDGYHVDREN
jgi:hypothetical protein